MNLHNRDNIFKFIVLFCCGLIPAFIGQFFNGEPTSRQIHITSFRYGKNPSVIRCNRGDTLHLTFSTDDTGHSFFLEEFDMDVKVSPGRDEVAVFKTLDPSQAQVFTKEVTLIARHPGILNYLISRSNYRCHTWCGPMHAFEQGKLIILPNTLLLFALGILFGIAFLWTFGFKTDPVRNSNPIKKRAASKELFANQPWLLRLVTSRWTQLIFIVFAMLMIYIVILTTLFGTKVSGRNLGVLLMWVIWLFILIAIMTPLGGRIWCTICPLPFFGDYVQRRSFLTPRRGRRKQYNNRYFGFFLTWPSFLRNDWLKIFFFMILASCSTLMVAVPWISGIAVVILLLLPTIMSFIWELRSFCRYICPVSVFVNPYARIGILSLRNKSQEVCDKCTQYCCLNGSPGGWACPYGINVGNLRENGDCGLCLECTRSCVYDNVTLVTRPLADEQGTRSLSEAWLTLAIFSISIVYSVVYLGHWSLLRDYINIIDKNNWNLFGIYVAVIWTFALLIVPGLFYLFSVAGVHWSKTGTGNKKAFLASAGSILPLGLSIWMAFVVSMLFVNVTFIRQSLSDPLGWGWDFLGTANTPWHQFLPQYIPWIQTLLILAGYSLTLRNLKRTWTNPSISLVQAFRISLPVAVLITIFAVTLILFFAD
jgi:polyferredoxin